MSRIQCYRYELIPKSGGKPREGALLRVNGGYTDLCPLPEFGDGTLEEELAVLARGESSLLSRVSLRYAQIDSICRGAGKPCIADPPLLKHHALLPDLQGHTPASLVQAIRGLKAQGFSTFKVKVGRGDVVEEATLLNALIGELDDEARLRLDPNARFTPESCIQFVEHLQPQARERIEFMEDPTPFDATVWRLLYSRYGIPIASDFEGVREFHGHESAYQIRIVKPVRESIKSAVFGCGPHSPRLVFTSALDHPIGQLQALYAAAIVDKYFFEYISPVCGIASHLVYEENPFSAQLRMEGSRLIPPPGTGWGFDELLEALPWADLN